MLKYQLVLLSVFFICLLIEYLYFMRKGNRTIFNFETSLSNVCIGIAERTAYIFLAGYFYKLYQFLYEYYRLFSIPNHWYLWVLLLFLTDLVWYWYHRLGHTINVFWGAHIVHHQSEQFNFTVAARITIFQDIIRNWFWCLLPLLGFHPDIVMTTLVVHAAYSFLTHTQMIGKLGVLEKVFITPSHHRVHHSSNIRYLDKNFGDVFVFWDQLFGTFQKEDEIPVYGLVHPLKSHSLLWIHFHYYFEIFEQINLKIGWKEKWRVLWMKPEKMELGLRNKIEQKLFSHRKKNLVNNHFKVVAVFQFILVIVFYLLLFYPNIHWTYRFLYLIFIVITLVNIGAQMEQRRLFFNLELLRLLLLFCMLGLYFESINCLLFGIFTVLMMRDSKSISRKYWKWLYKPSLNE